MTVPRLRKINTIQPQTLLWFIILLAIILRLSVSFFMGDRVEVLPGVHDQISYTLLAERLLIGDGFSFGEPWWPLTAANEPTAFWSFLYTLYLAGVYSVFGLHPLAARIIQAIVSGFLMPWLIYRLSNRSFGSTVALVAAGISAIYIYFFYFSAALMTETFFMLGILWTFERADLIRISDRWRLRNWIWLGIAMGLTVLFRQTFLPVIGLVGVWLLYVTRDHRKETLYGLLLSILIVGIMILPWTIRNYYVFNQFVLLNTNAGYAFFWANHPVHGTQFMTLLPGEIPYTSLIPKELLGLNEAALERALMQRGFGFIIDDPWRYILLSVNRIKDQFRFLPSPNSSFISNLSRIGSFGLFFPFMIYGVLLVIFRSKIYNNFTEFSGRPKFVSNVCAWLKMPAALWLGFFILYTTIHLLSWAGIRYRLPTDSIMIIFAGLGLVEVVKWVKRSFRSFPIEQQPKETPINK